MIISGSWRSFRKCRRLRLIVNRSSSHEGYNRRVNMTNIPTGQKRVALEEVALKIIYLYMDCFADCLYRMKLETPIMEVIDEAAEEPGVRGVLDGAHGLVRRH